MVQRPWFPALVVTAALACATGRAPEQARTAEQPAAPERPAARPAADPRLDEARAAVEQNRYPDAERLLSAAVAERPGDRDALVARARVRFSLYRFDDAMADLDRALALQDGADLRAMRGRKLALARRFEPALADLERAVALAPGDAGAWCTIAAVHVNRGDDVEVRRAFARAVELLGPHDAQERCWTELLALPPDPLRPQESIDRSTRGYLHLLAGEWSGGWREFLVAIRYAPDYQWAVAGVAEGSWRLGDVPTAERLFRQAIAKFPEAAAPLRADAQGKLAALLLETGRAAEARELARAALEVRPDRAHLLELLARACDAAKDEACAGDAWARLLRRPHVPEEARRLAAQRASALEPAAAPSR